MAPVTKRLTAMSLLTLAVLLVVSWESEDDESNDDLEVALWV